MKLNLRRTVFAAALALGLGFQANAAAWIEDHNGTVDNPVATSWRFRIDNNAGVYTPTWYVAPSDAPSQCSNYGIAFSLFTGETLSTLVKSGDADNFWWGNLGELNDVGATYILGGASRKNVGELAPGKYMLTATFHYAKEDGGELTYVVLPNINFTVEESTEVSAKITYEVINDGSQFQYNVTLKNNVNPPTAYSIDLYATGNNLQGHGEAGSGTINIAFKHGFKGGTLWLKSTVTVDGKTINIAPYDQAIGGFKKPAEGGFDMVFTAFNAVATGPKTGTLGYKIVPTKDDEVDHYVITVVTEGDKVVCPETTVAKDALEGTLNLTDLVPNKENGLWAKAKAVFTSGSESVYFQYPGAAQGWTGLSVTTPEDPESEGLDQKGDVETPVPTSWRMVVTENSGQYTISWYVCPSDAPDQSSNYGIAYTVFGGDTFSEVVSQGDSNNFWWGTLGEMAGATYTKGGATRKDVGMLEAGKYMVTATFRYAKEDGGELTYVVLPNLYFTAKESTALSARMDYELVGDGSQFKYKVTVKNNVAEPTAYSINLYATGNNLQGHAETAEGIIDIAFTDGFGGGTLWLKSTVDVDGQTINVYPFDKAIDGFKKQAGGGFSMDFSAFDAVATGPKTGTLKYKIVPAKDELVDHYVIYVVTEGDKVVCPETTVAKDALEGTLNLTDLVPNKENGLWAKAKAVFTDATESAIYQYPGEAQGWTGLSVTTPEDPQSEGLDQKGDVESPVAASWRMRIDDNSGIYTANWFVCPEDAPDQCSNYGIAFCVFTGDGFTEVVAQGDTENFWWGTLGEMAGATYTKGGATKKSLGMLEAGKYMVTATFHYAKEEGGDLTYVILPNLYFTTVESTALSAYMTYEVVGDGSQLQYKVTVKNNVEEPTAYSINLYAPGNNLQGHAEAAEGTIDIMFTDGFGGGTLWLKSTVDVDGQTINVYPYDKAIDGFKKPAGGGFDMKFTAFNPVATGPYTATLDYQIIPTKAELVDHYVIFVVTEGDKVVCPEAEINKEALQGKLYLSDLAQGKENGLWAKAKAVFNDGSESPIYQYPGAAEGWTGLSVTTPEDAEAMVVELKASNPQATGATTATLDYELTVKNVQDVDSYHIWVVTNSASGDITVFDDNLFALSGTLDLTNLKPSQKNELWVKWSVIYLDGTESEQLGTYPGAAEGWTGLSVTTQDSGIETIGADSVTDVEYYTLQGRRIANPAAGSVVICRRGTQVSKVLVR